MADTMTLTYKGTRHQDFTIAVGDERIYVDVAAGSLTVDAAIGREILRADPNSWEVVKAAVQKRGKDADGEE